MKITRYCKYWPLGLDDVTPFATVVQLDQVPSGSAVLPLLV
jgi:hypothetical protein